jgi:alpha-tubulin suppressor-like RCC1 family protein
MSSSRSTRRSARNRTAKDKEIVAPGFGTSADVERLSDDLGGSLPTSAVQAMMQSQGRGIRSSNKTSGTGEDGGGGGEDDKNDDNPLMSPKTTSTSNNAWADFIQEEGVTNLMNFESTRKNTKEGDEEEPASKKRRKTPTAAAAAALAPSASSSAYAAVDANANANADASSASSPLEYDLSVLCDLEEEELPFGTLVQSGTLDSSCVGRKPLKSADEAIIYHLTVPTVLLPKIAITKVCTSCNAAHAIAIDKSHQAYGWGRNEGLVLGSEFEGTVPTPQRIATQVLTAALGKSHTILLKTNGTLHAMGTNKVGQCGLKQNMKQTGVLKPCVVARIGKKGEDGPVFCKISCGEDFSVALDTEGILYTTGSSEFGQLANGETGEYFEKANKLAFANGYGFLPQNVFHQTDDDDDSRRLDVTKKTVQIPQQIRLQDVACGKHHALALEAPNNSANHTTRVFSWGSGDYGCLGHGRQQDEFFPRHVEFFPKGTQGTKLAAGAHCSLVLTTQGHVYYWGQHRSAGESVMKPGLVDALANNQHIVTQIGAGAQNVACSTDLGNTVVWGNGPYYELGLGSKKSSAKPAFVESLSGIHILDMACGQGSILYVAKEDATLPKVDLEAVEEALKK